MKTILLEFLIPIFTAIFYFFFENAVVFSIIIIVAVFTWWKYGVSARKSMEIASYVGLVVLVLWFIATKYWDDGEDKPLPDTQTSQSDVHVVETDRQDPIDLPQSTPTPSAEQPITAAPDSPHEHLMTQGIWYDPETKLYWDRCSIGQTWDGKTCQGDGLNLNWYDSQEYIQHFTNKQAKGGFSDWRLPTIQELSSIRHCSKGWAMTSDSSQESKLTENGLMKVITIPNNQGDDIQIPESCARKSTKPTIDELIFPNTENRFYWSSSSYEYFNYDAWGVDFSEAYTYHINKYGYFRVRARAVRSD